MHSTAFPKNCDLGGSPQRIGILGVGLLGGSVALAARRQSSERAVIGLVRDTAKGQSFINAGILTEATDKIEDVCRDCDVIVVATPVDRLADFVLQAANMSPKNCLITDVGSTKVEIVKKVDAHPTARTKFVAAHPIAGSEKSGAQHASSDLFDGKPIVMTPGPNTPDWLVKKCQTFWRMLGGNVVQMTASDHDVTLAAISHVPHLVSSLVAKLIPPAAMPLVGTGWKDITRVAAGDPEMWTAICAANRVSILKELDRFRNETDQLHRLIASSDDDALQSWLALAKQIKEQTDSE